MPHSKWTVLVYMGTDNLDVEKDLSAAARDDILEMERIGSREGDLSIVIQIDDKTTRIPRRCVILPGRCVQLETLPQSSNMADAGVLEDFLVWSLNEFPAERYLLIFWGHAYRYAFGFDASSGGQSLDYNELSAVLGRFADLRGGKKLEILGFDACGVSSIEVAYQFRRSVNYLVASEVGESFLGWPYKLVLDRIAKKPKIDPEELSKGIVNDYLNSEDRASIMLSALNLSSGDSIRRVMIQFSAALGVGIADPDERIAIAVSFELAKFTSSEPMVDLRKLCEALRTLTGDEDIYKSATALLNLLMYKKAFVTALERRGRATESLGGVSAFAPHVVFGGARRALEDRYANLDLSRETLWPAVVAVLDLM